MDRMITCQCVCVCDEPLIKNPGRQLLLCSGESGCDYFNWHFMPAHHLPGPPVSVRADRYEKEPRYDPWTPGQPDRIVATCTTEADAALVCAALNMTA